METGVVPEKPVAPASEQTPPTAPEAREEEGAPERRTSRTKRPIPSSERSRREPEPAPQRAGLLLRFYNI